MGTFPCGKKISKKNKLTCALGMPQQRGRQDQMPLRNSLSTQSSLTEYPSDSLEQLRDALHEQGIWADAPTYLSLIRACSNAKALEAGVWIHKYIAKRGYEQDGVLRNHLINMYGKCGDLDEARALFDNMARRNIFSWTIMIAAYAQKGHCQEALKLFQEMQMVEVKPDKFTFTTILGVCSDLAALEQGKEIHISIANSEFYKDVVVGTALMNMYNRCGCVEDAKKVFDDMQDRDVVSWNAMIAAYVQHRHGKEALQLYRQMLMEQVKPNKVTFITVLGACSTPSALAQGKEIHADIVDSKHDSDMVVRTALFNMYGKCGSVEGARMLFNKMHGRDLVAWNAMITTYVQHDQGKEALELYGQVQQLGIKPNRVTYLSALGACSSPADLAVGKKIHESIVQDTGFKPDVVVNTALVNMYSKCGNLEEARRLFDQIKGRDTVSWNAIILACIQHGHFQDALQLYKQMQRENLKPSGIIVNSVIGACSSLAALSQGKEIHAKITDTEFESDVSVRLALLKMYSSCGCLDETQRVFDKMNERLVGTWNAIIAAYAQHGKGMEALQLFHQMQHEDVKPDRATVTNVLNTFIRAGMVDDAWHYFESMNEQYGIIPSVEHYACMVELFGRTGQLEEAEKFIDNMPLQADAGVWKALLVACRIHGDLERGKRIAEYAIQMEPKNAALYVLLSNMYATDGRWDDVAQVKRAMVDNGAEKQSVFSFIELNNTVHRFCVNDRSHPECENIYTKLEMLSRQMEISDYKPTDSELMLHDVEEELVQHSIGYHSEKLAIAFGLTMLTNETLRIVKNVRMCPDCHASFKCISKMVGRRILVRDASGFHQFKDGECLCKDYW